MNPRLVRVTAAAMNVGCVCKRSRLSTRENMRQKKKKCMYVYTHTHIYTHSTYISYIFPDESFPMVHTKCVGKFKAAAEVEKSSPPPTPPRQNTALEAAAGMKDTHGGSALSSLLAACRCSGYSCQEHGSDR